MSAKEDRRIDVILQHMEFRRMIPKLARHVRYENRIVAFMDILGWSQLITGSTSDASAMRRLAGLQLWWAADQRFDSSFNIPNRTTRRRRDVPSVLGGEQRTHFSDSLVLSWPRPRSVQALNRVLFDIADTVRNLFLNRFLVRGAVVTGKLFHRPSMIFGPAIVDAYKLESTLAVYPRVLVSKVISTGTKSLILRRDHDGLEFIDFLRLGRKTSWYADFMNQVGAFIKEEHKGLKHDLAAQSKWSWLISYFNKLAEETPDAKIEMIGSNHRCDTQTSRITRCKDHGASQERIS